MYSCGHWDNLLGNQRGKPTTSTGRKAAALYAIRRGYRTPPGSETRACIHRGNLGTREIQMFPCVTTIRLMGAGQPMRRNPGAGKGVLQPDQRAKVKEQTRYRGRTAKSEQSRNGHPEVLADHSTDGQGKIAGR